MLAPTLLALTSTCAALLANRFNDVRLTIFFAFAPIFAFLSLRYQYGNDYNSYIEIFQSIALSGRDVLDLDYWHVEKGWVALNKAFSSLNFYWLVAFLSFANCLVYGWFIIKFAPRNYYWLATLLYIIVPENMLVQLSAMRQTLAILIFLISTQLILDKKYIRFVLIIYIATFFHLSALFLLPIFLIPNFDKIIGKSSAPFFVAAYFLLFYSAGDIIIYFKNMLVYLHDNPLQEYMIYEDEGTLGSGFGVLFYGVYLWIVLYLYDRQTETGKLAFLMTIISIYVIPFSVTIGMIYRIGFYFSVFSIVTIPLIASSISNILLRRSFITVFVMYSGWNFIQFFVNENWKPFYSDYNTILQFML